MHPVSAASPPALFIMSPPLHAVDQAAVVWREHGRESWDGMPIGNGDLTVMAWTQADGGLFLSLGKNDAWDPWHRLLKIGLVRVVLDPNPFRAAAPFVQKLDLLRGVVILQAEDCTIRLWVDMNHPTIWLEMDSATPRAIRLTSEPWRVRQRILTPMERHAAYGYEGEDCPVPVHVRPDIFVTEPEAIVWYQYNTESTWGDSLELQGLGDLRAQLRDPLLHRTYGARLRGAGLRRVDDRTIIGPASERQQAALELLTTQTPDVATWLARIRALGTAAPFTALAPRRAAHENSWRAYWERSWILISGDAVAERITRGVILQRFLNACGGRGAFPIKFNGSTFICDPWEGGDLFRSAASGFQGLTRLDSDYRRWGGAYWVQNTRCLYWSMLATGDFALCLPWFDMVREALPLARAMVRRYYGHEGAAFPETTTMWGLHPNASYGWRRAGKAIDWVENPYMRYYWSCGLELVALMIDYAQLTADEVFARETLLPCAREILAFYHAHYPRDAQGRLCITPATVLEGHDTVVNPLPEIAGLRRVLSALLAPDSPVTATATLRGQWQALLEAVPPIPLMHLPGASTRIAAAESAHRADTSERECPALYAVHPYRIFGLKQPGLDIARATFEAALASPHVRYEGGWHQHAIWAARLGLIEEAQQLVARNFDDGNYPYPRFPAFRWYQGCDDPFEQETGNVAITALVAMLMQHHEGKLVLFPAWPPEWEVEFRLPTIGGRWLQAAWRQGAPVGEPSVSV